MIVNKKFVMLSRNGGWKCSGKRQVSPEEMKMDFGAVELELAIVIASEH